MFAARTLAISLFAGFVAAQANGLPVNATFDDLVTGSTVGSYDYANYTGFTVITLNAIPSVPIPQTLPALLPNTPSNYIATQPSLCSIGSLVFACDTMTVMLGQLHDFSFGCTTYNSYYKLGGIPQACEVIVTARCLEADGTTYGTYNGTFNFNPTSIYNAPMKTVDFSQVAAPNGLDATSCSGYTFTAESLPRADTPVTLALDTLNYDVYGMEY